MKCKNKYLDDVEHERENESKILHTHLIGQHRYLKQQFFLPVMTMKRRITQAAQKNITKKKSLKPQRYALKMIEE